MKRNLYLFDFDGTITNVDTLFDFLKFSFPKSYNSVYYRFIPKFILAKLKILEKSQVKEQFISTFLKGKSRLEIKVLAFDYFENRKNQILRSSAVSYILDLNNYHDKYIVSASVDLWLQPFAEFLGTGLICTNAYFDEEDNYSGKFASLNCNYEEKKNRIEKEINLSLYDEIYAFGDSSGDKAMFSISTNPNLNYFGE